MRLQQRDKEIIKELFRFGCLTTYQIAKLFSLNLKICQRRLRLLIRNDYIRRISIPTTNSGRSPYLYYPGKKAEQLFELPASKPRLNNQLSHQQKNTDILIHIKKSANTANTQCTLLPEHIIRASNQKLISDGAFKLTRDDKVALFLIENCAGTEVIKSPTFNEDIENKIIRYCEIFQNNDVRFYNTIFEYQFTRFRLLFITNNIKRLNAISQIVKKHDVHGFIYMTIVKEFMTTNIFSPIWNVPAKNEHNLSIIKEK